MYVANLRWLVPVLLAGCGLIADQAQAACPSGRPRQYRSSQTGPALTHTHAKPVTYPTYTVTPEAPILHAGEQLALDGNFFGSEPGFLTLSINKLMLEVKVMSWESNQIEFEVPNVGFSDPTPARLDVIAPDGRVIDSIDVLLLRRLPFRPVVIREAEARTSSEAPRDFAPTQAETQGMRLRHSS